MTAATTAIKRTETAQEASEQLGIHEETLRKYCRLNKLQIPYTRLGNGQLRFNLPELVAWKLEKGVTFEDGGAGMPKSPTLDAAKLRKENALASRYELMVDREKGKLLPADEVLNEWANIGQVVRSQFQSLGSHLLGIALQCGMPQASSPEFQSQAESAINEILKKLSESESEITNSDDDAASSSHVLSGVVSA
jgi:hypothetical protein